MKVEVEITLSQETRALFENLISVLGGKALNKAEIKPSKALETESDEDVTSAKKASKSKKKEVADEAPEEKPAKKSKEDEKSTEITAQEVREALVKAKRRIGSSKPIKELLKAHGADNVDELDPKEYEEVIAEAEEL